MALLGDILLGLSRTVPGVIDDIESRQEKERKRQEIEAERKRQEMIAEQLYQRGRMDRIADTEDLRAHNQRLLDEEINRKAIEKARAEAEQRDAAIGFVAGRNNTTADAVERASRGAMLEPAQMPGPWQEGLTAEAEKDPEKARKVFRELNELISAQKLGTQSSAAVIKNWQEQDAKAAYDALPEDKKREENRNAAWRAGRDPAVAENQAKYWEYKAANEKTGGDPDSVKLKDQLTMADRQMGRAQQALNAAQNALAAHMTKAADATTKAAKAEHQKALDVLQKNVQDRLTEFNTASGKLKTLEDRIAGNAPTAATPAASDEEARSNAAATIAPPPGAVTSEASARALADDANLKKSSAAIERLPGQIQELRNAIKQEKDPEMRAYLQGELAKIERDVAAQPAPAKQGAKAGPEVGAEVNGFVFKGGNPNDRANWEPKQAGRQSAAAAPSKATISQLDDGRYVLLKPNGSHRLLTPEQLAVLEKERRGEPTTPRERALIAGL